MRSQSERTLDERRNLQARVKKGDKKAVEALAALDFDEQLARVKARSRKLGGEASLIVEALKGDKDALVALRHAEWLVGSEAQLRRKEHGTTLDEYKKFKPPSDAAILDAARRYLESLGVTEKKKQQTPTPKAKGKTIDTAAVYAARNRPKGSRAAHGLVVDEEEK